MPLPSTFAELIKNIDEYKDAVIEFKKEAAEWELYPEANMRAYMTHGRIDGPADDVGCINFDYTKFDEFNRKYESSNYYDESDNPRLTAREAGYYNPVESIYVMLNDNPNRFMRLVATSKYYEQYLANRIENQSYVEYLEKRLEVALLTVADILV